MILWIFTLCVMLQAMGAETNQGAHRISCWYAGKDSEILMSDVSAASGGFYRIVNGDDNSGFPVVASWKSDFDRSMGYFAPASMNIFASYNYAVSISNRDAWSRIRDRYSLLDKLYIAATSAQSLSVGKLMLTVGPHSVQPMYVDMRGLGDLAAKFDELRDNPPNSFTRVVIDESTNELSNEQICSINAEWAQKRQCSWLRTCLDVAYALRYPLLLTAIGCIGYRYAQAQHINWANRNAALIKKIGNDIERIGSERIIAEQVVQQLQETIKLPRAESNLATIVDAYDRLPGAETARKTLQRQMQHAMNDALSSWTLWKTLLKTCKDKLGLLLKALSVAWAIDNYIVRTVLGYSPFEPPKIVTFKKDFPIGEAHDCRLGVDDRCIESGTEGVDGCTKQNENYNAYMAKYNNADTQRRINRNRKIAAYITPPLVLGGLGAWWWYQMHKAKAGAV